MAEFSAGLLRDTARVKVCDFAFLTSSGGKFLRVFHDNCASHSPSNREK